MRAADRERHRQERLVLYARWQDRDRRALRRIRTDVAVIAVAVITLAAVLALAACGGDAGPAGPPAGDVLACRHFVQQGQKLKSEAAPSLADLALAAGWVAGDARLAVTPALKAAFTQDSKAISDLLGAIGGTAAQQAAITRRGDEASAKIKGICARDGVKAPA